MQGLKLLADALERRSPASREDLEFLLIASFALATTLTFAGPALAGALGHRPTRELAKSLDGRARAMLDAFIDRAERGR